MRLPARSLALLLSCIAVPAGYAQPGDKDDPAKPIQFKGDAKISSHKHKMEKGAIYRISVKGDGFTPEVRIDGQFGGPLPANPAPQINVRGKFDASQLIFSPTETKEYTIKVDILPNTAIGQGPHSYTLTIQKARFQNQVALKEPELKITEDTAKLELGKVYNITVTGRGFEPDIQILDDAKSKISAFNSGKALGFGRDAEYVTDLTFAPPKTGNYRILVAIGPYSKPRTDPLQYETKISEMKTELVHSGELTNRDPTYARRGGPHRVHEVKLEANKKYQIDMMSSAFDSYLFLEDDGGNYLTEDDDSGGNLNARIVFTPAKTGTYRVIATTFGKTGITFSTTVGPYTVIVMENPNAVARFPALPSLKK